MWRESELQVTQQGLRGELMRQRSWMHPDVDRKLIDEGLAGICAKLAACLLIHGQHVDHRNASGCCALLNDLLRGIRMCVIRSKLEGRRERHNDELDTPRLECGVDIRDGAPPFV